MKVSFDSRLNGDVNVPGILDMEAPFGAQVQKMLEAAGPALKGADEVALTGSPVGAIAQLAGMEIAVGLPTVTLYGFTSPVERVGALNLSEWRHRQVRPYRASLVDGSAHEGWTLLDGAGRGVTPEQVHDLTAAFGCSAEAIRVVDVSLGHVDVTAPQVGVVEKLMEAGLSEADLQSGRVALLPPGFSPAAVVLATAVYGLSEVWPRVVRLNRSDSGSFDVTEVLDIQALRQWGATHLAAAWAADSFVQVSKDDLRAVLNGDLGEQTEAHRRLWAALGD